MQYMPQLEDDLYGFDEESYEEGYEEGATTAYDKFDQKLQEMARRLLALGLYAEQIMNITGLDEKLVVELVEEEALETV
jgi:predicted transposase YdaD